MVSTGKESEMAVGQDKEEASESVFPEEPMEDDVEKEEQEEEQTAVSLYLESVQCISWFFLTFFFNLSAWCQWRFCSILGAVVTLGDILADWFTVKFM